jgi:phosphatidylinositol kinase/protein kinase (PI-3  family)
MKLPDLHPYDSFIVGINNIYFIDYKGDFHINAPFILAANKTISTGSTYVLIDSFNRKKSIVRQVRLQDAYYDDGIIYLLLQDIFSQETFTIDLQIECTGDHYSWVLIDLDFIVEELNSEIGKRTTLSDNS